MNIGEAISPAAARAMVLPAREDTGRGANGARPYDGGDEPSRLRPPAPVPGVPPMHAPPASRRGRGGLRTSLRRSPGVLLSGARAVARFAGAVMHDMYQVYGRPALGVPAAVFGALAVSFAVAAQVPEANYSVGGIIALVGFGFTALVGAWKTFEFGRIKIRAARAKAAEDREIEKAQADLKLEQLRKDKDAVILQADIDRARLVAEKEVLEDRAEEASRARTRAALDMQRLEQKTGLVGKVDDVASKIPILEADVAALKVSRDAAIVDRDSIRAKLERELVDDLVRAKRVKPLAPGFSGLPPVPPDAPLRKLLLVDDHAEPSEALRKILELRNYKVDLAVTCSAAVAALEGPEPPECVVLNLEIPDGQAPDLMRLVARLGMAGRIRIVGYSADGRGPLAEEAARLNNRGVLVGPFDFLELLNAIGDPAGPLAPPSPPAAEAPRLREVEARVEQHEARLDDIEGGLGG